MVNSLEIETVQPEVVDDTSFGGTQDLLKSLRELKGSKRLIFERIGFISTLLFDDLVLLAWLFSSLYIDYFQRNNDDNNSKI